MKNPGIPETFGPDLRTGVVGLNLGPQDPRGLQKIVLLKEQ